MEYAKLQGAFLRTARFRDADMAARGAWATLIVHCADQENGGRVVACKAWTDRQWLSRTDCMRGDVDHLVGSELGRWDGEDLVLDGYDRVAEGTFHAASEVNRRRAKEAHEKRRAQEAAAAAAAANGAAGSEQACRRQDGDVPPAVPPAGTNGAAGTGSGCHPPTHPSNQPSKETAGAAPPPKGAAASGSRRDPAPPPTPKPPRDEVGAQIGRYRRAHALLDEMARGGGLAALSESADEAVRSAVERLTDPETRTKPSTADIDAVEQWWVRLREAATP